MIRGQRGTEYAVAGHSSGETFVAISTQDQRFDASISELGRTFGFRALQKGKSYSTPPPFVNDTLVGRSRMPYSPTHFEAEWDVPFGDDITLDWVRRVRKDGELVDFYDAPLDETSEDYEVYIYTDGSFVTKKRTFSINAATTVVYIGAQQVTDFGIVQTTVFVGVAQLSSIVGLGFEEQKTFVK